MKLADLQDPVELNRLLAADPDLRANMLEMGFIKPVPFMRDHNEQHELQYVMTDAGLKEMRERITGIIITGSDVAKFVANDRS